ncbi:hypothetical protein QO002_004912 [Pararhizobium capsulatum DSM 1112]|uniref:Uncharacterized protein n=1 Tax=Pararhizobium capsulatum DSM 1112 TaxID=1121113 RepID=A0ABU0BWR4_9HYPH|nr:hypothetical protein [Pararhizobium capsulatum]MDQ0322706.1 hypothetical protein [Pararhizobium capsulatum DSM 1112]
MAENDENMIALIKAMADSPKRDNSAYHKAMSEARRAFDEAELTLGGPVKLKTRTKIKANGNYVVQWTFKRAT